MTKFGDDETQVKLPQKNDELKNDDRFRKMKHDRKNRIFQENNCVILHNHERKQ